MRLFTYYSLIWWVPDNPSPHPHYCDQLSLKPSTKILPIKIYFTILKWYFSDRSSLFKIVRSVSNMSDQRKSLSLRGIYSCCLPNLKLNLVLRRPQRHTDPIYPHNVGDYFLRQEFFISHYWSYTATVWQSSLLVTPTKKQNKQTI